MVAARLLLPILKQCDQACLSLRGAVLAGFSVLSKACVLRNTVDMTKTE